jgi:hypothetical protein
MGGRFYPYQPLWGRTPLEAAIYAGLEAVRSDYWTVGIAAEARLALARPDAEHAVEQ